MKPKFKIGDEVNLILKPGFEYDIKYDKEHVFKISDRKFEKNYGYTYDIGIDHFIYRYVFEDYLKLTRKTKIKSIINDL